MATLRQRSSLSQDYGGELGIEPVSTPTSSGPQPWRRTFENVVWVAAACFAVYYGDSKHQLFHVVFYDPRIRRLPFKLGLVCLAVNTAIFAYLAVWLRHIIKTEEKWELVAPAAIPTATLIGLVASLFVPTAEGDEVSEVWWSSLLVKVARTIIAIHICTLADMGIIDSAVAAITSKLQLSMLGGVLLFGDLDNGNSWSPTFLLKGLKYFFTLFMAFVVISPYLPPYARTDGESLRSD